MPSIEASPPHSQFTPGLKWLCACRIGAAIFGLAGILFRQVGLSELTPHSQQAYAILIFALVLNLPYLLVLPKIQKPRAFAIAQLWVDLLLITALLYFTGGLESVFAYYYFGVVLAAAILVAPRTAIVVASSSTIAVALISILFLAADRKGWVLPFLASGADRPLWPVTQLDFLLKHLVFFSLALHAVAILSGRLAEELSGMRIVSQEILQNILNGVLVVDQKGKISYINPRGRRLLGFSEDRRIAGSEVRRQLAEGPNQAVLGILSGQQTLGTELSLRDVEGREFPALIRSTALRNRRGEFRGTMLILEDLSINKEKEDMARLAERLQVQTEMGAALAHEIRNPLASVRGAIQELFEQGKGSDEDRRLTEIILRESDRLDRIVSRFLQAAHVKKGTWGRVDLCELLRQLRVLLEKRPDVAGRSVHLELSDRLFCWGDHEQLQQVFLNLGLNALEATAPGGRLEIRAYPMLLRSPDVGTRREISTAKFVSGAAVDFVDHGNGIAPEHLDRLGEPFFTTKEKGTGMGLSIATQIVEAHKGKLTVESQLGKGTRFTVWLPAASEDGRLP